MREAPLDKRLQDGVPDWGFGDGATCDSGVECGDMMTVKVTDQVRGAEAEGVIEMVHKRGYVPAPNVAVPAKLQTWRNRLRFQPNPLAEPNLGATALSRLAAYPTASLRSETKRTARHWQVRLMVNQVTRIIWIIQILSLPRTRAIAPCFENHR